MAKPSSKINKTTFLNNYNIVEISNDIKTIMKSLERFDPEKQAVMIGMKKQHTLSIDEKFSKIDEKFSKIDEKFSKIDDKFSKIDEKFSKIDEKVSRIDERVSRLEDRFLKMDEKLDIIMNEIKTIKENQIKDHNLLMKIIKLNNLKYE